MTIIKKAEAQGRKVHAFGSGWALSDCAVTYDYLVDTSLLNREIQEVQNALKGPPNPFLFHIEAGMSIRDLYNRLDKNALGPKTLGGASGQTLAGVISTGTHGGDTFLPPIADSILAIHLVGQKGTQYWIEPTNGITVPAKLIIQPHMVGISPTNVIYDDDTFNAVLVSMGCFGIIYALVLEARKQYALEETTTQETWSQFKAVAANKDLDPKQGPRFLQLLLDPYGTDGNNFCHVSRRVEVPLNAQLLQCKGYDVSGILADGDIGSIISSIVAAILALPITTTVAFSAALIAKLTALADPSSISTYTVPDLLMIIIRIISPIPALRPLLPGVYRTLMSYAWPIGTCGGKSFQVMDTSVRSGSNPFPGYPSGAGYPQGGGQPGYSIEMFFDATNLTWAHYVDALIGLVNKEFDEKGTFLTGYIALRFMGQTRALLGMQQWPITCSVEVSTLQSSPEELDLLGKLQDLMYTFNGLPHWGQQIDLHTKGDGKMYSSYPQWRTIYAKFSNNFQNRTFENDLSYRWNLTSPS